MIGKITLLLVISVVACSAIAKEWPADLFPGLCPDYPNCNMEILANFFPDGRPRSIDVPIVRSIPLGNCVPGSPIFMLNGYKKSRHYKKRTH